MDVNFNELPSKDTIETTIKSLSDNGHLPEFLESGEDALKRIKEIIPQGSSIMNGASKTLEKIGFVDYLKSGNHGWDNLHEKILSEEDPEKQAILRSRATLSEYYLGSVHAVTEDGKFLIASNTGSQLSHIVYTSRNLIFVVGVQKIVSDINKAFERLNEYVIPLEDKRMQEAMGMHTYPSKILIVDKEQSFLQRKSHVLLVNESLGF